MTRGNPMLTVRVTPTILDQLRQVSATLGMSASDIVRDALEAQLRALIDAKQA